MAEKVTFKVSAAAAFFLRPETAREDKLKAAAGQVKLGTHELLPVVFYLCYDADPEVKRTAVATLKGLPVPLLTHLLANSELHPRILDTLVQLHFDKPELAPLFAAHPMLSEKAAAFLTRKGIDPAPEKAAAGQVGESRHLDLAQGLDAGCAPPPPPGPATTEATVDEESEEFKSKYQLAQTMGVSDKIKAAMTGDKEWRSILIKDANKLVSIAVVKNPRITDGEILTIAKSSVQNDEIMRLICANKEWIKNAQIRKALVENNKTPIAAALRFVPTLSERDLSMLARNKNVASVVASQARRLLMAKKDGR